MKNAGEQHAASMPPPPSRKVAQGTGQASQHSSGSSMPPPPAKKGVSTNQPDGTGGSMMPPPARKHDRGGGEALGGKQALAQPGVAAQEAASQGDNCTAAPSAAAPTSYTPPPWAGVPEGVPYRVEVLKGGAIVEARDISLKDHYTLGRTAGCDFLLEHPSASRLHAVLQFNGSSKAAFIYDNASTHGTYLNKQRIKPHVHVPVRVGDTLKFGQSSRLFLLCGPEELLPEEGLTRSQKAQLAELEYAQRMKERDLRQSAAAMEAALSTGASWGMQEDAVEEVDEDAIDVDWRAMMTAGKLSEKQLKQAEKIRQKEYKIKNLQTEIDRIVAKEKLEAGLTQGQVSTLARNEQAMEALRDELEDMEEALIDSVKDAVADRNKEKIQAAKKNARRRKRGTTASDEEYLEGSDSDDDFYDRTVTGKAAAGTKKARVSATEKDKPQVESAQSLYGKREALKETVQQLTEEIAQEEKALSAQSQGGCPAGAQPHPSAASAAGPMDTGSPVGVAGPAAAGVQAVDNLGAGRAEPERPAPATPGSLGAEAAAGTPAAEAAADGDAGAAAGGRPGEADDSLDAFMSSMAVQLDDEKLRKLKHSLEDAQLQLARTERLLKIADPDGWLKPTSKAAQAAKAAAQEAMEAERKRREAAALMAAKKKKEAEAAGFVEEVEDEEDQPSSSGREHDRAGKLAGATFKPGNIGPRKPVLLKANPKPAAKSSAYNPHRLEVEAPEHWGLQVRKPAGSAATAATAATGGGGVSTAAGTSAPVHPDGRDGAQAQAAIPRNAEAAAAAARMIAEFSGGATDRERAAQSNKATKAGGAGFSGGSMFKMAAEAKANEEAAAQVAADMQILSAADRRKRELEELAAQEKEEQEAAAAFVASKEGAAKEAELRQRLGY